MESHSARSVRYLEDGDDGLRFWKTVNGTAGGRDASPASIDAENAALLSSSAFSWETVSRTCFASLLSVAAAADRGQSSEGSEMEVVAAATARRQTPRRSRDGGTVHASTEVQASASAASLSIVVAAGVVRAHSRQRWISLGSRFGLLPEHSSFAYTVHTEGQGSGTRLTGHTTQRTQSGDRRLTGGTKSYRSRDIYAPAGGTKRAAQRARAHSRKTDRQKR